MPSRMRRICGHRKEERHSPGGDRAQEDDTGLGPRSSWDPAMCPEGRAWRGKAGGAEGFRGQVGRGAEEASSLVMFAFISLPRCLESLV